MEDVSRADVFTLLDDANNRGPLITAAHGDRVDFADSLEIDDAAEANVNDEFAYGRQLMAPWKLYCALTSGSFVALTYFVMDLLGPLKKLSLVFQRDSLAFSDIASNIRKTNRALRELLTDNMGLHFKLCKDKYIDSERSFKNTPIHNFDAGIDFVNSLRYDHTCGVAIELGSMLHETNK